MKRIVMIAALTGLSVIACSTSESSLQSTGTVDLRSDNIQLLSNLVPFDDCDNLLTHIKEEASERVGPYGLDKTGYPIWIEDGVLRSEVGIAESGPSIATQESTAYDSSFSDSSQSGVVDFTGTNVQELGVDEPDIIKTDGERILTFANGVLSLIVVNDGNGSLTDQLIIGDEFYGYELFIHDDSAFLFANGGGYSKIPFDSEADDTPQGFYQPQAQIVEVDISDPSNLRITSQMTIAGNYLSARLVGSTIRMAVNSAPNQLEWVYPSNPGSEERATRFNKELIEESTLDDWVPSYQLTSDAAIETGRLIPCDKLHKPNIFSGFDVVSLLSFDIDSGLTSGDGVAVFAGGQTVYSSSDRFYIATTKWADAGMSNDDLEIWSDSYNTDVHAFSISVNNPAEYVASGSIDGTLLNQFSMDEHDGYLRIVTTTGSPWSEQNRSESQLVVMEEQGDSLIQVGQVGGLGKGESLYSVRLLDDIGFAVTFRQIDPFYVIDLNDPLNPEVVGELKIPGFSTYLHPIDDNIVLGIGQNATEQGRILGLKVSSFDVSNPTNPFETSTWVLDDTNSFAEYDHRAFQIKDRLAVLPIQSWSNDNGAVLLQIDTNGELTQKGLITHAATDNGKTTDCKILDSEIFIGTQLEYLAEDFLEESAPHVQLCGPNDAGGYGSDYCDILPINELHNYVGDLAAEEVIEIIEANPSDRIEQCWPSGPRWDLQVQRSLFINDSLWTMSWNRLQSNGISDDDDLGQTPVISIIPLDN